MLPRIEHTLAFFFPPSFSVVCRHVVEISRYGLPGACRQIAALAIGVTRVGEVGRVGDYPLGQLVVIPERVIDAVGEVARGQRDFGGGQDRLRGAEAVEAVVV